MLVITTEGMGKEIQPLGLSFSSNFPFHSRRVWCYPLTWVSLKTWYPPDPHLFLFFYHIDIIDHRPMKICFENMRYTIYINIHHFLTNSILYLIIHGFSIPMYQCSCFNRVFHAFGIIPNLVFNTMVYPLNFVFMVIFHGISQKCCKTTRGFFYVGLSENRLNLYTQWLMIIISTKWLFHWEYTPFSDIPMFFSPCCCHGGGRCKLLLEGAPFRVCSADEVRAWEETRIEKVQRALEAKERRLTDVGWGGWIAVKPWENASPLVGGLEHLDDFSIYS